MKEYFRPICQTDSAIPDNAVWLADGWSWFTHVELLSRGGASRIVAAADVPRAALDRLTQRRAPIAGVSFETPRVMGILNATPDSFSDGGDHFDLARAIESAQSMLAAGASVLDVGGESTRPGADYVDPSVETKRTAPVIEAILSETAAVVSIDTRKALVAEAALDAGALIINDVSALSFDEAMLELVIARQSPVCVMHAQGTPETMQENPTYHDVLLDVYDALEAVVARLENAGLSRSQIIVDPGIGFGKTQAHNLALLSGLSVFHGIGCPILLGVSRKGFIGKIGRADDPKKRAPGSIAVALDAVRQGVQILRVHDVEETAQALALWRAVSGMTGE